MCYANNFFILSENGIIEHNGNKYLLLEELTKMLPYQVWCKIGVSKYKRSGSNAIRIIEYSDIILGKEEFDYILHDPTIVECKPYLRQLTFLNIPMPKKSQLMNIIE